MRLTQGRNRVFGIFLALMVMWVIFHQVHPKRTIDRMRGLFAKMLSLEAKQLASILADNHTENMPLRNSLHETAVQIRTLSEAISYEFDRYVQQDLAESSLILQAVSHGGALFLHMKYLRDSSIPPSLYADLFHEIITDLKQASSAMFPAQNGSSIPSSLTTEATPHYVDHVSLQAAQRDYQQLLEQCQSIHTSIQSSAA